MASSRLQRWSLTLSAYQYKLVYLPGQANGNADGLSRLPLPVSPSHTPEPQDYVFVMDHLESTAVNQIGSVFGPVEIQCYLKLEITSTL